MPRPRAADRCDLADLPCSVPHLPRQESAHSKRRRIMNTLARPHVTCSPVQVLRQSPVAHLRELEEPLDHPEGMLGTGVDVRLGAVLRALDLVDPLALAIALIREVLGARGARLRITSPCPRQA